MSDSHPMAKLFGLDGDSAASEEPTSAADPTTTAETGPDAEEISASEALAALAGEAAPQDDAADGDAASEGELEAAPDPDAIARERDELLAWKAEREREDADAAEEEKWGLVYDKGEAFYANLKGRLKGYGEQQGWTPQEIKAFLSDVVDYGIGLDQVPGVPPGTQSYLAWKEETLFNYANDKAQRATQRTQPSVLDQLTRQFNLDESDRTALAKFQNYPPDALTEIARTLGAKNARVTTTQQHAVTQARQNVAQHLSAAAGPGTPGAAPKPKLLKPPANAQERRDLTRLMLAQQGMLGPTG